jgi:CYTH domain-containing protein
MGKEIERKFLIKSDDWHRYVGIPYKHIYQGYIPTLNNTSVRIRIINDLKAELTLKGLPDKSGMIRSEYNIDISLKDAKDMIKEFVTCSVTKDRCIASYYGHNWEIDIFKGDLAGLMTVEVEMKSADEEIKIPSWVGKEVTNNSRFSNYSLAANGVSKRFKRKT